MLEARELSKRYDDVVALNQLSFSLEAGKVLGLVGPNGAGKTTAMRILCGIIPPDYGFPIVNGINVRDKPEDAKMHLAFIPAEPRLFDYITVREHLAFYARVYDVGDKRQAGEEILERLELSDKADHLPGALSRGMKQKLMLACALIHDPKVMILDEPFTGLDPASIRLARTMLRERVDQGACVIISSHLLAMVESLVDRVLILQKGAKVAEGTLDELRAMSGELGDAGLEEVFLKVTGTGA